MPFMGGTVTLRADNMNITESDRELRRKAEEKVASQPVSTDEILKLGLPGNDESGNRPY